MPLGICLCLGLLVICFSGCSKNGGITNPFASAAGGRSDRVPSGSPAQQVAQLEQWRRDSELEVKQLRQSVAGLTEKKSKSADADCQCTASNAVAEPAFKKRQ